MARQETWKTKTLLLGAGVGLVTGLVAALIIIQRAEKQNGKPKISAGEGVRVGLGVLGLLRLIADFGD
jgi:hypothetical protein